MNRALRRLTALGLGTASMLIFLSQAVWLRQGYSQQVVGISTCAAKGSATGPRWC